MQYQQNQTCCQPNYSVTGWCYSGCGQLMPIVPGSNPALQIWNGQNFLVADGSSNNPIFLPALQTNAGTPSHVVGSNNAGQLFFYPYAIPTTVQNLAGGAAGNIPWQSAPSVTNFVPAGDANSVFISGGAGSPSWLLQSSLLAGKASNINGGSAGEIPYQTGSGTTSFTPLGSTGQLLQSGGSGSPTWISSSSITANGFSGSLSGDVTGTQSSTHVIKVNGVSVPTNKTVVGTNSLGQFIDASSAIYSSPEPLNIQSGTSYTLQINDAGTLVVFNNTSPTTVTVPLNSSVPFQIGQRVDLLANNSQVTITGASGVIVNSSNGLKLRTQFSPASLFYLDINVWILMGDLTS